ncbi:MAG: DUF2203 domain-containing protein [Armatimonadota bacterium]
MALFDKHFTLDEALQLLPEVRAAFQRIFEIQAALGDDLKDLNPLLKAAPSNGGGKKSAGYLQHIIEINKLVNGLTHRGILIKDINTGLIDFPHMRQGEEVFLCYRMGEATIRYWHEIGAGFAGRQDI